MTSVDLADEVDGACEMIRLCRCELGCAGSFILRAGPSWG